MTAELPALLEGQARIQHPWDILFGEQLDLKVQENAGSARQDRGAGCTLRFAQQCKTFLRAKGRPILRMLGRHGYQGPSQPISRSLVRGQTTAGARRETGSRGRSAGTSKLDSGHGFVIASPSRSYLRLLPAICNLAADSVVFRVIVANCLSAPCHRN